MNWTPFLVTITNGSINLRLAIAPRGREPYPRAQVRRLRLTGANFPGFHCSYGGWDQHAFLPLGLRFLTCPGCSKKQRVQRPGSANLGYLDE